MINRYAVEGNLGKDPELKTTSTGQQYAIFSLAWSESYTDRTGAKQTNTEWFSVKVWGKLANNAMKLAKGDLVYVEGKWRSYQNDGTRYHEIVATHVRKMRMLTTEEGPHPSDLLPPEQSPWNSQPQPVSPWDKPWN